MVTHPLDYGSALSAKSGKDNPRTSRVVSHPFQGEAMMSNGSDEEKAEQAKASVRARVEHPFRWVKGIFGYSKVRYRGLDKNMNRLYLLLGFSNLLTCRRIGYAG